MKIVQVAPFEETVPPKKYGGTELVIYNLTQELVKRGHKVYLIAAGDSKTKAKLFPVFPRALRNQPQAQDLDVRDALKFIGTGKVLQYLKNLKADIIHNHLGWRLLPFSPLLKMPTVTTLHGPLDIKYQKIVYGAFAKENYISISDDQRAPFPGLNYKATIHNGIDIKKFPFSEKEGDYLAFLARMSPEKGPIEAIKVAKKTGLKLKMAAKVDAVDKEFFEKRVAPLIDGKRIEFLGEVDHAGKAKLLKGARALLAPLQWREPFGLFLIEAMACGTPVVVFDRGAAREIVEDEKTGFIVKNTEEMVTAVQKINRISRRRCRRRVEKYFSAEKMTDAYEKVYRKILQD